MAMLTNETRPMPWDDLYALATPKRAFNMLFNTVNVLRPRSDARAPGGSLMVYRSGHAALEMFDQPDDVVEQAFLDDLYAIYPDARGIVAETILLKLPRMLPYAAPGRSALQPALERPLGRVHLAGDYLGGVYTDTAISSGRKRRSPSGQRCSPPILRANTGFTCACVGRARARATHTLRSDPGMRAPSCGRSA